MSAPLTEASITRRICARRSTRLALSHFQTAHHRRADGDRATMVQRIANISPHSHARHLLTG
jgi:hypothetical protein